MNSSVTNLAWEHSVGQRLVVARHFPFNKIIFGHFSQFFGGPEKNKSVFTMSYDRNLELLTF